MKTSFARVLESLAKEKETLALKVHQLVASLKPVLRTMGYTLIEATESGSIKAVAQRSKTLAPRETLVCPQCRRTFAKPMHLGRHLAAAHKGSAGGGARPRRPVETSKKPRVVAHVRKDDKTTTRRRIGRARATARPGTAKAATQKVA